MLSRSTVVGALVVAELAIVGVAVRSLGFGTGPAHPQMPMTMAMPNMALPALSQASAAVSAAATPLGAGERTFATGATPHVVIALDDDAPVTVRAVDSGTVRVMQTISTFGWPSRQPTPLTTVATPDGIRIAMAASESGMEISLGHYHRSIAVDVPPGAHVEITSSDGRVTTTGLRAPLRVNADDGTITISDQHGDVDAKTSDGHIYLSDVDADHLIAHSSSGSIIAKNVRLADGELTTDDGHVDVTATASSDSVVAIHTDDGSVRIGSGLSSENHSSSDDDDRQSRTVTLGSAHGKFTIATSDGHVSLSQGAKV
jgi:hypothetical protein